MKLKKFFLILCATAILLSATAVTVPLAGTDVAYAEEMVVEEFTANESDGVNTANDESGGENILGAAEDLTAPQNVREENGFVVWDEVNGAYGYIVSALRNNTYCENTYYTNRCEAYRFFYEHILEFGDYEFTVRAFDEGFNLSEESAAVTVTYAPNFEAPANVRLNENELDIETLTWDEVENAARYNVRMSREDNADYNLSTTIEVNRISLVYWLDQSGDYQIRVQAMDKDYNVSEWTEYITISHVGRNYLDTPQNVRFDESGENILWDDVEGADHYSLYIGSLVEGKTAWFNRSEMTEQARYDNWKSIAFPFSAGDFDIYVQAYNSTGLWSMSSQSITSPYKAPIDETIEVPDVQFENNCLKFDIAETADDDYWYWLCIKTVNGIVDNEIYGFEKGYDCSVTIDNRFPEGDYEAKIYAVDGNGNYNVKSLPFTLNTVHDETVWIPEVYYKFDNLIWDFDRLRHDDTIYFWIRIKNNEGNVVQLSKSWSETFTELLSMEDDIYTIDVCAYEYTNKIGIWSTPLNIQKHDNALFDKENETTEEVERAPEAEDVPEEDRITSITINPAFNMKNKTDEGAELDLTKIKIKAKEIYDEEGLQRASEALGETISGNKHYNLLDLTLLYNGEDFSNGYEGLVQVIIPIPSGHRDKKFSCFRLIEVDGKMVKEEIPGEQTEDSYIIYLEHFSEYALVGGYDDEHTHVYGENWESDDTKHWKECACGEKSEEAEHTFGEWTVTKAATENEEGEETRTCEVCEKVETRAVAKLPSSGGEEHTHVYGETWKSDGNSHWKECECGDKSEAAPHDFGEWTITKEATEDEEGEQTRECEICGEVETISIPKLTPEQSVGGSSNVSSGSFTVPEKKEETAENTEQTTSAITAATTDAPVTNDSSLEFANTEAAEGAGNNTSNNAPTETIPETTHAGSNANTGSVSNNGTEDKNINTGVAIAIIPAASAAAIAIVFKKRK